MKALRNLQFHQFLIGLPVLMLALSATGYSATLTVNSLADNTISGDGIVTLREAIVAATNDTTTDLGQTGTANDTLNLSDLSGSIVLTSNLPKINKTIALLGPGADQLAITGSQTHTFLTLESAANVHLHGLTIENFYRTSNGGAISSLGVFSAANCVFRGNHSHVSMQTLNGMGSAIYGGSGSSIQLTDCLISDNVGEVTADSGTRFFIGSAVGALGGSINATRCTFDRNSTLLTGSSTGGGGMGNAVGVFGGGSITLTDSTIKNGFFQQPGTGYTSWGSVYVGSGSSQLTADGCTWTGNVGYPAVGIYIITNSTNTNSVQLVNCTFAENGNHEAGAMLFCYANSAINMTIEHCTFARNTNRANFPACLEVLPSATTPQVQITNTVMASADKDANRPEIRSGFTFTSNGFNFISNDGGSSPSQPDSSYASTTYTKISELVSPLADNGGQTYTCSLPDGSPLIDTANPAGFASTDQRAVVRPRNGGNTGGTAPDIGAYERFNGNLKVTKTVDRTEASNGKTLNYVLTVKNEHPTEMASGIEVTDVLPPNLLFTSSSNSTFSSVNYADGVVTALRSTLAAGASASVTITCTVQPYTMSNTASATQLGYEIDPADNTGIANTTLITPPPPRVTAFTVQKPEITSATELLYQLSFDRNIVGLDATDFSFVPPLAAATIQAITPLDAGSTFHINVSDIAPEGSFGLLLLDNDSISSQDGDEPLAGSSVDGSTTSSFVFLDRTEPISSPLAAAVSPEETTTTKFFLLYSATDDSGISGVQVYLRKGTSAPFQQVTGGPFSEGFVEIDTAIHGGYGTYELYTTAIDKAGNIETKPEAPEISVRLEAGTPTAALDWHLFM